LIVKIKNIKYSSLKVGVIKKNKLSKTVAELEGNVGEEGGAQMYSKIFMGAKNI
jgi:hypothetical protein